MTTETKQQFVGDELGWVNVAFTPEMLSTFLDVLNTNHIENENGAVLTFAVREEEPGRASMWVTETTKG